MHATIQDLLDSRQAISFPFLSAGSSGVPLVYFATTVSGHGPMSKRRGGWKCAGKGAV